MFREKEFQAIRQPFLLRMNGECLAALEKLDYRLRFKVTGVTSRRFDVANKL